MYSQRLSKTLVLGLGGSALVMGLMVLPGTATAQDITVQDTTLSEPREVCVNPSGQIFYRNIDLVGTGDTFECEDSGTGGTAVSELNFNNGANINMDAMGTFTNAGTTNLNGATNSSGITNTGNVATDTLSTTGNATVGGTLGVTGTTTTNGITNNGNVATDTLTATTATIGQANVAGLAVAPGSDIDMGMNIVHGVADPIDPYDAANKRYVDQQVGIVNRQVDDNTKGIAMAMAMGGGADLRLNETVALSADWGTYDGEHAGAVSGIALLGSDGGTSIYGKGSFGFTGGSNYGGRAGVQIGW